MFNVCDILLTVKQKLRVFTSIIILRVLFNEYAVINSYMRKIVNLNNEEYMLYWQFNHTDRNVCYCISIKETILIYHNFVLINCQR